MPNARSRYASALRELQGRPARPDLRPAAGLAMAVLVGAAALRLSAPSAEASPLRRAIGALEDASVVVQGSETPWKRGWRKADMMSLWRSGVKRRERSGPFLEFGFDGHQAWAIDRIRRRVQVAPATVDPLGRVDDGRAILARYDKPAYRLVRGPGEGGGLSVLIEARDAGVSPVAHSVLRLDAGFRPLSWTFYDRARGQWVPSWRKIWSYPPSLPDSLFAPAPPPGFKVVRLASLDPAVP